MEIANAVLVGVLFSTSIFLLLQRHVGKVLMGLVLLSQASNLLILTAGGLTRANPPLIEAGKKALEAPFADPLPQALILTAIVISFGVLAFSLVLIYKSYQASHIDDLDQLRDESA